MHADAFLAAAERLPVADLDTLTGGTGLVIVAPHPDDESLGCGGVMAAASARGQAVAVVIVSDGCGSHTHSALYPPDRLRALREAETLEAVAALGVPAEGVTFLRLPDAGVPRSANRNVSGEPAVSSSRSPAGMFRLTIASSETLSRYLINARIELPCAATTTRLSALMAGAIDSSQSGSTRSTVSLRHSVNGT